MKLAPLAVVAVAVMTLATRDVYFAAPGTDPIFGISLTGDHRRNRQKLPTLDAAWRSHAGPLRAQESVFQPLDWRARPLVRRLPNGELEFFTLPGFHPKYGMRLGRPRPKPNPKGR